MLLDARRVPADSLIEADVCVVGGGPTGLTLARELGGRDLRVCLLESGGREFDADTQALAAGRVSGGAAEPLHESRCRRLGGSAHLWREPIAAGGAPGLRVAPLEAVDFARRDWLLYSGWPFARATLEPYYERVHRALDLGPVEYAAEVAGEPPALDRAGFEGRGWRVLPARAFTDAAPAALAAAPNVQLYCWANVVEIETTESAGEVVALRVACLGGTGFRVRARVYVLAAGGIENARLLLVSDRAQRGGLGNGTNVVGRYFMEHQQVRAGSLVREAGAAPAYFAPAERAGIAVQGRLVRARSPRGGELLAASAFLVPERPERAPVRIARRATAVAARLRGNPAPPTPLPETGDARWDEGVFGVHMHTEQAPHPENRVFVDGRRDRVGCRTTHLHWLWRERDFRSARDACGALGAALAGGAAGGFRGGEYGERPPLVRPGVGHHLGAVRMHDDARYGAVNANGRLHTVGNLYVAGSATFPTGGCDDPTLTALALALRLADHVKRELTAVPAAPRAVARTTA
jgi:choline dehydrogenase-like flavoprotein